MTSFSMLGLLLSLVSFLVFSVADNWLGPGKWSLTGSAPCDNADQYSYKFDFFRKKINRTHEGIAAHFVFPEAVDDYVGVRIVVCKFVDGGCKPYRVVTEKSLGEFGNKFIPDNIREIFRLTEIEPPEFPVKAGEYKLEEYAFNYDELPETAAYGAFRAELRLTRALLDLSCTVLLVEFNELA